MSCEFEGGIAYFVYRNDHPGERFLTRGIHNGELGAKVVEHGAVSDLAYENGGLGGCLPKQTTGLGGNEVNAVGTCPLINFGLLVEGNARKDNLLWDLHQPCVICHVGDMETHLEYVIDDVSVSFTT